MEQEQISGSQKSKRELEDWVDNYCDAYEVAFHSLMNKILERVRNESS